MGILKEIKELVFGSFKNKKVAAESRDYSTYYARGYQGPPGNTVKKTTKEMYDFLYTEDIYTMGRGALRFILDRRLAFMCSEGVQVVMNKNENVSESQSHRRFFKNFIRDNKLDGSMLYRLGEQLEVWGYLSVSLNDEGKVLVNKDGKGSLTRKLCENRKIEKQAPVLLDVFEDALAYEAVYHELRTLNQTGTKITPVFSGLSGRLAVDDINKQLIAQQWKTGQVVTTCAPKFEYLSPNTNAISNLNAELESIIKSISAKTGVPPHWIGHVDMMSNRSTAIEMFEVIEYATFKPRRLLTEFLFDLFILAQEHYLDVIRGGEINEINYDFKIDIPLLSDSKFMSTIDAYNIAYQQGWITLEEVRSKIPGLSSIIPQELIEKEKEKERREKEVFNKSVEPVKGAMKAHNREENYNGKN